jgi:transketolase
LTVETLTRPRSELDDFARLNSLMSLMTGDEKHEPSSTSTKDVLWVLYDRILRVTPKTVDDDERDRFYLSKGHGPMAYYAVLAAKGFLDPAHLPTYGDFDSPLGYHPDRHMVPGVEISSGSLGHGLPLAVGTVLGLKARGFTDPSTWVLIGDAEMDEGSNHEAVAFAGRLGLEQLHAIVIDNDSATIDWPGGIEIRFAQEGWAVRRVDGRDHDALEAAYTAPHPGRPLLVVAEVERKDGRPRRWSGATRERQSWY